MGDCDESIYKIVPPEVLGQSKTCANVIQSGATHAAYLISNPSSSCVGTLGTGFADATDNATIERNDIMIQQVSKLSRNKISSRSSDSFSIILKKTCNSKVCAHPDTPKEHVEFLTNEWRSILRRERVKREDNWIYNDTLIIKQFFLSKYGCPSCCAAMHMLHYRPFEQFERFFAQGPPSSQRPSNPKCRCASTTRYTPWTWRRCEEMILYIFFFLLLSYEARNKYAVFEYTHWNLRLLIPEA